MRAKLVVALAVAFLLGVAGLAQIERVVQASYEVKAWVPGYLLLVIPNTLEVPLNRFGISLAVEGTVTGALALQGTGPAVIEGGPLYWVVTLPAAGLAPKGILLVSVKVPVGTDPQALVARLLAYKVR